jgi:hypothetical protein
MEAAQPSLPPPITNAKANCPTTAEQQHPGKHFHSFSNI